MLDPQFATELSSALCHRNMERGFQLLTSAQNENEAVDLSAPGGAQLLLLLAQWVDAGYREGKGVEKDKYEAYVWLLLSSAQLKSTSGTLLPQLLAMLESDLGMVTAQNAKAEARKRDEKFRHSVLAGGCTWKGALAEFPTPPPIDVQKFCQQEKPIKVYEKEAKAEQ